jgi:hypothetical protein
MSATPIDGGGKGYIRLHRKLLDHPLFKDKPVAWLKIWIYILLRANWRESTFRPRQGEVIVVPAGSLVTSLEKLGTHAALSKEHARRCLDYLERTHAVTLVRTHHWTMITIVNWAAYQQSDDEVHHAEHHAGHHAESQDETHEPPRQTPHAATPSKEVKNLSKKYESNSAELDSGPNLLPANAKRNHSRSPIDPAVRQWFDAEFWPVYPRREGRSKALEAANAKATTPEKRAFYLARLVAQLPEYDRRKQDSGQRVIPMGSTWFHQDRAEDEFASQDETGDQAVRNGGRDDYPAYVPLARSAG